MWPPTLANTSPGVLVETRVGVARRDAPGNPHSVPTRAYVPHALPANVDLGRLLARTHVAYTRAVADLSALDQRIESYANPSLLIAPIMEREAIDSSKIENTFASATELALLGAGASAERTEVLEVANYRAAMRHGIESDLPICKRLIRSLHEILMRGVRGEDNRPGQFRTTQNWIGRDKHDFGTCRFVPPPPAEVEPALDSLDSFLNTEIVPGPDTARIPALIAMACAHYQFEAIHPFSDGNGRVGRLLIPLSLRHAGMLRFPVVYVSGALERRRQEYYDGLLGVSLSGDWESWTDLFLSAIGEQARSSLGKLRRLDALRRDLQEKVRSRRAAGNLFRLIDSLLEKPAITIGMVADRLKVTAPSANSYIKTLEGAGCLREWTGRKHGRIWVAQPIIDIIDS